MQNSISLGVKDYISRLDFKVVEMVEWTIALEVFRGQLFSTYNSDSRLVPWMTFLKKDTDETKTSLK